jgi:rhombotail lipoprotein
MRLKTIGIVVAMLFGLSGCESLNLPCLASCHHTHAQNSTSLVGFLYPNGEAPKDDRVQPQLHLPLRVGLAFLPSQGFENERGLDAAHKEALLEQIRQRFKSRKFVADIVVIPDYYLRGKQGFADLEGVQRLYGIDLMALVSSDQVMHEDDNDWSLAYLTIVGAYVIKGTRHDVSTLVDLAVVDPATHSLVLRAGGFDNSHGNTRLIAENVELRHAATQGFDAATQQMIEHFDGALTHFETEVHEGKSNVQIVSNNGKAMSGGSGGVGSIDWLALIFLVPLVMAGAKKRD